MRPAVDVCSGSLPVTGFSGGHLLVWGFVAVATGTALVVVAHRWGRRPALLGLTAIALVCGPAAHPDHASADCASSPVASVAGVTIVSSPGTTAPTTTVLVASGAVTTSSTVATTGTSTGAVPPAEVPEIPWPVLGPLTGAAVAIGITRRRVGSPSRSGR